MRNENRGQKAKKRRGRAKSFFYATRQRDAKTSHFQAKELEKSWVSNFFPLAISLSLIPIPLPSVHFPPPRLTICSPHISCLISPNEGDNRTWPNLLVNNSRLHWKQFTRYTLLYRFIFIRKFLWYLSRIYKNRVNREKKKERRAVKKIFLRKKAYRHVGVEMFYVNDRRTFTYRESNCNKLPTNDK